METYLIWFFLFSYEAVRALCFCCCRYFRPHCQTSSHDEFYPQIFDVWYLKEPCKKYTNPLELLIDNPTKTWFIKTLDASYSTVLQRGDFLHYFHCITVVVLFCISGNMWLVGQVLQHLTVVGDLLTKQGRCVWASSCFWKSKHPSITSPWNKRSKGEFLFLTAVDRFQHITTCQQLLCHSELW